MGFAMKDVLVRISLRRTEDGGRQGPILPVRDFSCPVFFRNVPDLAGHGYDCRLLVRRTGKPIAPGETADGIPIIFLSTEDVLPHLRVGISFELWEGRIIGDGEVMEMV